MRFGIDINGDILLSKVASNRLDDKISIVRKSRDFSLPPHPRCRWLNMQLPFQWLLGRLSPKAKWPKRDAGHLPPANSEEENAHSVVSFQRIVLEHRDKFNFTFLLVLCSMGLNIG
jgi:hypothetical protein